MTTYECIEVKRHKDVGKTIDEWQKNGWHLHTYACTQYGIGGDAHHHLLFEKGEQKPKWIWREAKARDFENKQSLEACLLSFLQVLCLSEERNEVSTTAENLSGYGLTACMKRQE